MLVKGATAIHLSHTIKLPNTKRGKPDQLPIMDPETAAFNTQTHSVGSMTRVVIRIFMSLVLVFCGGIHDIPAEQNIPNVIQKQLSKSQL